LGVTLPGAKAGGVVAVLGSGIRGLGAGAAAKEAGAAFVMVTGLGPFVADRLALAPKLGARTWPLTSPWMIRLPR
jgi:alcohol dehydrogenase